MYIYLGFSILSHVVSEFIITVGLLKYLIIASHVCMTNIENDMTIRIFLTHFHFCILLHTEVMDIKNVQSYI